jgi:hypothetical protein
MQYLSIRYSERLAEHDFVAPVSFTVDSYDDVDSFNHRRLRGEITDDNSYVTPAEVEAAYYRQDAPALEAVTRWPEQSWSPAAVQPSTESDSGPRLASDTGGPTGDGALFETPT